MSQEKKEEEMICGLTADERNALQRGLGALPDTMPPRAVWHRIREQAEAEGLIARPRTRRPSTWYAGAGIAASVVLAVLIVPGIVQQPPDVDREYPTEPQLSDNLQQSPMTALQALQVESRELEDDLRSLPSEPRVVRAGLRATILDLEDRIAAIDYQLSDPEEKLTPDEQEIFWRERVRLMKSLVQLRSAQAQRTAY